MTARLVAALGVLPFLPPGRGALILILGGLVMLPLSLLMSRIGAKGPPRHRDAQVEFVPVPAPAAAQWQPVHADPRGPRHAIAVHAPRPWGGTGLERAIRKAVGATRLLGTEPGRYVIALSRCDSCARRRRGCEVERTAIARAVSPYLNNPHVVEVACAQLSRRAACTFDIRGR